MTRVEFSNVGVLDVGVTRLILIEGKGVTSKVTMLGETPVPLIELIETNLVRLDLMLGMGDTVIVKTPLDGRTRVEESDEGRPVPTKVVGASRVAVRDVRDKLELATLETGSIGKVISRDVEAGLPDRPVPTKVLGVSGVAVWDISDKLELATLVTGSIGKTISRDVEAGLTGRPVGTNVILLGVLNSVATPAVTVTYWVVFR